MKIDKMKFLKTIDKIAKRVAPGPSPSFTPTHIFMALEALSSKSPIGRTKLSETLKLGEGATRTLVKRLQREGIIKSTKSGCVLTNFGKEIILDLGSKISRDLEIPPSSYTLGRFNVAVLIRSSANVIGYGVEQRDAALKAGAMGATTLTYKGGKFMMPGKKDAFKGSPEILNMLIEKLKPEEGDSIVIGSADDRKNAEFGAKAAALETLRRALNDKANYT
jgi:predicted transcriptional regulator